MQVYSPTALQPATIGSSGLRPSPGQALSPPAAVSLKPFLRDSSADKRSQPSQPEHCVRAILHQSSYEEQHLPSQASQPSQLGPESEPGLMASRSGSQVRPGTSLFYEPSATKNDCSSYLPTQHHQDPEIPRYRLKDQSFNNYNQSRSSSAPATAFKYPGSSGGVKRLPAPDPSFGTLERSLGGQDPSYVQHRANPDEYMRNKRSVQVPHPENRVLFELTTISNELNRENMTTVQTSLIPNSNQSLKQQPQYDGRRRGSSERPLLQATHDLDKPTQPFTVSSQDSIPQHPYREHSEPSHISAANLNAAYREVVMKQARKQLGMTHDHSNVSSVQNQPLAEQHHRKASISASNLQQPQRERAASQNRLQQNQTAPTSHSQLAMPRVSSYSHERRSPAITSTTNANQSSSLKVGQPYQQAGQHRFLYTGTNMKSQSFQFDGVTPNKYELTTDNDQAYTYSMYTETMMGRSDHQSKAKSRKDTPKDYFSSVGTTPVHPTVLIPGELYSEASKMPMRKVTRESPECEMLQADGTAGFPQNQLGQYASQSSGERKLTERMSSNHAVDCAKLGALEQLETEKNQFVSLQPQHVHSDSIMSAQFQPESGKQMFSQENLQLQGENRLLQERKAEQYSLSHRARQEEEHEAARQPRRQSAGLRSPGSFDRKTFTLGDKAAHMGVFSKTDMLSLPQNQLTSPTEQLAQSKPLFNPVQQLQQIQRDSSMPRPTAETERGNITLAPSSYDISSDLQDLLKLQQQYSQQPLKQFNDQEAVDRQYSSFAPQLENGPSEARIQQPALIDLPLSQPYQASEHMRSYNTLERGGHGQQSQMWQQPQYAIQSHRPQLVAKTLNQQFASSSNPLGISDPSISITNHSQTNVQQPIQPYNVSQRHFPPRQNPMNQSNEETLKPRGAQHAPNLLTNPSQSPRYHAFCQTQQYLPQHQVLNTQRAQHRPAQDQLCAVEPHSQYTEATPISSRVNPSETLAQQRPTNLNHHNQPLQQQPQNPNQMLLTLQHNVSQVTNGSAAPLISSQTNGYGGSATNNLPAMLSPQGQQVFKQEVLMLRRQLNDARNSNLFLKKQTLQLQHTINMQNIQISQLEQVVGAKDTCQEEEQAKISMLEVQFDEQSRLSQDLMKKQEETEELYKQRVQDFVEELEHLRADKAQHAYGIQANVMQLQSAMQHLAEIESEKQTYLTPFLSHFDKLCATMLTQISQLTFAPHSNSLDEEQNRETIKEQRYQLKQMKRQHNFERFRKEIRNLCRNHYRAKIHDRDIELQKSLKHLKSQEKQLHKLEDVCQQIRQQYHKACEDVSSLTNENQQLVTTFEHERLRLEKAHLAEVSRLHKAVKTMHKKARVMERNIQKAELSGGQNNQNTRSRTTVELDTVVSESENLMTSLDQQPTESQSVMPLSSMPSREQLAIVPEASERVTEQQLLALQNEQFRQTLEGQNVLIQELQRALSHNQEMHQRQLYGMCTRSITAESDVQTTVDFNHNRYHQKPTVASYEQSTISGSEDNTNDNFQKYPLQVRMKQYPFTQKNNQHQQVYIQDQYASIQTSTEHQASEHGEQEIQPVTEPDNLIIVTEQNQPLHETRKSNTDEKLASTQIVKPLVASSGLGKREGGSTALNFRDCTYFSNQTSTQQINEQHQYQGSVTELQNLPQRTSERTSSGAITEAARMVGNIK